MGERAVNGGGTDGHGGESDQLEALRTRLLQDLQARTAEIEEAIVTAALNIELATSSDAEEMAGLRDAARALVELIGEVIGHGASWVPQLPPSVKAQVRRLARAGVALEDVMRGYYATTTLCFEFVSSEIADLPAGALPYLVEIQTRHGDRLMSVVSAEYNDEVARLERDPDAWRRERAVRRLLAGQTSESPELDYDLQAWHIGMIAVGKGRDSDLRRLAETLGCRLLLVPRSAGIAWVWLGAKRPISFEELERAVSAEAEHRVSLATGEA